MRRVASYPTVSAAQLHLGEAYRSIGQTEEAVNQFRTVLAVDPEHVSATFRLEQLGASAPSLEEAEPQS